MNIHSQNNNYIHKRTPQSAVAPIRKIVGKAIQKGEIGKRNPQDPANALAGILISFVQYWILSPQPADRISETLMGLFLLNFRAPLGSEEFY